MKSHTPKIGFSSDDGSTFTVKTSSGWFTYSNDTHQLHCEHGPAWISADQSTAKFFLGGFSMPFNEWAEHVDIDNDTIIEWKITQPWGPEV